jgi:hypothetical protein
MDASLWKHSWSQCAWDWFCVSVNLSVEVLTVLQGLSVERAMCALYRFLSYKIWVVSLFQLFRPHRTGVESGKLSGANVVVGVW